MKHLQTYELFLGGKKEPRWNSKESFENSIIEQITKKGIEFKTKEGSLPIPKKIIYFEIPGIGRFDINYEWFGDVETFVRDTKTLKGMKYKFKSNEEVDYYDPSLRDHEGVFSERLSRAILNNFVLNGVKITKPIDTKAKINPSISFARSMTNVK